MNPIYSTNTDANGNKFLRVSRPGQRGFRIQTNGNLPETHSRGVCPETDAEARAYVTAHGTARQKKLLAV